MYQIILASASPRRKELLEQIGIKIKIIPSMKEEIITSQDPTKIVKELSYQKAMEIAEQLKATSLYPTIIIGADTIVTFANKIMGKPKDGEDAKKMLTILQGNTHQVYTGVTIVVEAKVLTFYEKTDVIMYPMTSYQIDNYIKTGEPMDKAGSYGIQGKCAAYIREIHGDYNNVVGLPIARLCHELEKLGYSIA